MAKCSIALFNWCLKGYPLIREVIVRWIYDQLAGTAIEGENG